MSHADLPEVPEQAVEAVLAAELARTGEELVGADLIERRKGEIRRELRPALPAIRDQVRAEERERLEKALRSRDKLMHGYSFLELVYGAEVGQEEIDEFFEALNAVYDALSTSQPEEGKALSPEEARELFALWLAHGMRPPEIDEAHPLYTGAMKLGRLQPGGDEEPSGTSCHGCGRDYAVLGFDTVPIDWGTPIIDGRLVLCCPDCPPIQPDCSTSQVGEGGDDGN